MKKAKQKKLVFFLASVLATAGVLSGATACGGNAPDFKVVNKSGKSVQLSDYQGKPVVVNFWATWCGPCLSELQAFEDAYYDYRADVQFMMVNLTTWEKTPKISYVKDFLLDNDYDFPAFFDTKGSAEKAYNVKSIPLTLFIDEDGDLVYKHSGAMSESQLNGYIEEYLL